MTRHPKQPNLVGFVSHGCEGGESALQTALRAELEGLRGLFGPQLTVVSSIRNLTDLTFLQCCVQLRIPVILILPEDPRLLAQSFHETHWTMATHLMSVSLACYVAPAEGSTNRVCSLILEWADVLLCAKDESAGDDVHGAREALEDAAALGIPSRAIHGSSPGAGWNPAPDIRRPARHGFETRKDLLEFFDSRLGAPFLSSAFR